MNNTVALRIARDSTHPEGIVEPIDVHAMRWTIKRTLRNPAATSGTIGFTLRIPEGATPRDGNTYLETTRIIRSEPVDLVTLLKSHGYRRMARRIVSREPYGKHAENIVSIIGCLLMIEAQYRHEHVFTGEFWERVAKETQAKASRLSHSDARFHEAEHLR